MSTGSMVTPLPDASETSHDPRTVQILAKSIYRELRQSGLTEQDVMALAGELLSLLASDVKDRRAAAVPSSTAPPADRPSR